MNRFGHAFLNAIARRIYVLLLAATSLLCPATAEKRLSSGVLRLSPEAY